MKPSQLLFLSILSFFYIWFFAGITLAQSSSADWKSLFTNWPVTKVDAHNLWKSPDGTINQAIFVGLTMYVRQPYLSTAWTQSSLSVQNNTSYPLPGTLDDITTFYQNGQLYQTLIKDNRWWSRIYGNSWNWSGNIFTTDTTTCSRPLPTDSIDTYTVFPYQGNMGATITKDAYKWFTRNNQAPVTYNYCESNITIGPDQPARMDSHTSLEFFGKTAETYTSGNIFWFIPDTSQPSGYYKGVLAKPGTNKIATVSPYIFGTSLIWHKPHNQFSTEGNIHKITASIKELGVTMLRFPGGCGGDAYNWQSAYNANLGQVGNTIDTYITILKNANIQGLYSLNLEGTAHANLNCHNFNDYPGTVAEATSLTQYLISKQAPITHFELGNEPWAPSNTGIRNWTETWTSSEYAVTAVNTANTLKQLIPQAYIIAATGNKPDWESPLQNQSSINAFQNHPYFFGELDPRKQGVLVEREIVDAKGRSQKARAITEYALHCWSGVPTGNNNPYLQTMGHSLYVAQMLEIFIRQNIYLASYWHLFEDNTTSYTALDINNPNQLTQYPAWRCGLVKESPSGEYLLTPAGKAFSLIAKHTYPALIETSNQLYPLTTTQNEVKRSTLIINPEGHQVSMVYDFGFQPYSYDLISLNSTSLNGDPSFSTQTINPSFYQDLIIIPPYSINVIEYGYGGAADFDGDFDLDFIDNWQLIRTYGKENPLLSLVPPSVINLFDINKLIKLMLPW